MRKLTGNDIQNIIGAVNEGYTIKHARIKCGNYSDSDHFGIAFAKDERGYCVTWEFKLSDDNKTVDYYWGHYIADERAAMDDFYTRE